MLVAIGLTLYQIRQVDASNRELIRSNELARDANLEISRPRVQVYLQADRQVWKDRTKPVDGTMFVAVTNIGRSPATNVRLAVDIPFTSMEEFFKPGMMATHFEDLNSTFDGSTRFPRAVSSCVESLGLGFGIVGRLGEVDADDVGGCGRVGRSTESLGMLVVVRLLGRVA
ncbi:hypothetical protein, partial [Microbacterium lacticum]|uniref:hypothetical protein n=1 Tax=Microbacterium lacticum TaxID=33885 RepID=UPI001F5846B5